MATGKITLGSNGTKGHKAVLKAQGYGCSVGEELVGTEKKQVLSVECAGFIDKESFDLNTEADQEKVKQAIANKKLFTYRTKFKIPGNGDTFYSGIYACRRLGPLSAFVARDPSAAPVTKKGVSDAMSGILGKLNLI